MIEYTLVAAQITEEGIYFGVQTKDYPDLVFSFERVRIIEDDSGNIAVDFVNTVHGKNEIETDLTEYQNRLMMQVLSENTDLKLEDLLPSHQL
jgi:hypothetical protein